ncbi:hypothetical protein CsatB_021338 [Cannabis sativa]
MGRQPCCDKIGLKRGPWTIEEDHKLMNFILNNGIHCWRMVPKLAGLLRCGKSCRLRWINYLRPDLKRGGFTESEENQIIQLHSRLGNRWSKIAAHFPGRTDNEIKNHWNTRIKKRLKVLGVDPITHQKISSSSETTTTNTNDDHDHKNDQDGQSKVDDQVTKSNNNDDQQQISTITTTTTSTSSTNIHDHSNNDEVTKYYEDVLLDNNFDDQLLEFQKFDFSTWMDQEIIINNNNNGSSTTHVDDDHSLFSWEVFNNHHQLDQDLLFFKNY